MVLLFRAAVCFFVVATTLLPGGRAIAAPLSDRRWLAVGLGALAWVAVLVLGVSLASGFSDQVAAFALLSGVMGLVTSLVYAVAIVGGLVVGYWTWRNR